MATEEIQIEHFGIDFGTTNIAVGGLIVDKDTHRAFRVLYGEDGVPFPSILAVKDDKETNKPRVQFGRKVKTQQGTLQDDGYVIIKSIKTDLGNKSKFYYIESLKKNPTQIVEALIKSIRVYLSKNMKRPVNITSATVAVPVDFDSVQRRELCEAFKGAGITVNKIVSESMAAYVRNREEVANLSEVMVFDWGGGTLDISLLNVEKGKAQEDATSGWKVAGDKIDETIAEFVHNRLVEQYGIKTSFKDLDVKNRTKILTECEKAKITFSDEDEIDEPAIISMFDYCGEKKIIYKLAYDDFEAKISDIVKEAVGLIGGVLEKANKNLIDLNAIIMVGGSSKLLPLKTIMEEEFRKKHKIKIVYPEKPQWSVAEGAAIIDSVDCAYEINQDINVVMSDGSMFTIISKGSKIPHTSDSISFGTIDNSTSAHFIFSDNNENFLGRIVMPAKGFLGEYFTVVGTIGNDMIADICVAGSGIMSGVGSRNISINQLSYRCDISEIEDYKFEIIE